MPRLKELQPELRNASCGYAKAVGDFGSRVSAGQSFGDLTIASCQPGQPIGKIDAESDLIRDGCVRGRNGSNKPSALLES
jgi:hypothetical protein